jgi:hypothetical protein
VHDLAQAMPISALDDFETRLTSRVALISRHFQFAERDRTLRSDASPPTPGRIHFSAAHIGCLLDLPRLTY